MEHQQGINNYFVLLAGTTGMIVLAMGLIIFFITYQKKLLLQNWQKQQRETAYQAELVYSNIITLEKERARIASDLHDEIGAKLSALRLQVARTDQYTGTEAKDIIDQTIDNVRRISYDLLPPGLEDFGLEFAVRNLCEKLIKYSDLLMNVEIDMQGTRCDYLIDLALYRILQELINNTLKHSTATKVSMSINSSGGQIHVKYTDNGKGYDYQSKLRSNSLGLKNILSRVNQIHGTIKYQTSEDNTVRVMINIPIILRIV